MAVAADPLAPDAVMCGDCHAAPVPQLIAWAGRCQPCFLAHLGRQDKRETAGLPGETAETEGSAVENRISAPNVAEIGRYRLPSGLRVLIREQIGDGSRIVDRPAGEQGRRYLVDRDVDDANELRGLADDYIAESERLGRPAIDATPVDDALLALAA